MNPLVGRRTAEHIAVMKRLKSSSFPQRNRPHLRRMDVAVAILGEMGNDCLGWPISAQPCVLVIKDILAVAHQVLPPMLLQEMNAVLSRSKKSVEFEVTGIVVANSVVEDQVRRFQNSKFRQVTTVT